MSLQLFFHPFSSYSQKALIALHENATPFTPRMLSPQDPATGAEFERMAGREWASGDAFSLADCAAAPALFYADWSHKIAERFAHLLAYRARLLARPSFALAVDAARPFRAYFPLGAPDRD